jgi:hypothetical protein
LEKCFNRFLARSTYDHSAFHTPQNSSKARFSAQARTAGAVALGEQYFTPLQPRVPPVGKVKERALAQVLAQAFTDQRPSSR